MADAEDPWKEHPVVDPFESKPPQCSNPFQSIGTVGSS